MCTLHCPALFRAQALQTNPSPCTLTAHFTRCEPRACSWPQRQRTWHAAAPSAVHPSTADSRPACCGSVTRWTADARVPFTHLRASRSQVSDGHLQVGQGSIRAHQACAQWRRGACAAAVCRHARPGARLSPTRRKARPLPTPLPPCCRHPCPAPPAAKRCCWHAAVGSCLNLSALCPKFRCG